MIDEIKLDELIEMALITVFLGSSNNQELGFGLCLAIDVVHELFGHGLRLNDVQRQRVRQVIKEFQFVLGLGLQQL